LPTAHCPPPTATFACKRCHNIRFTSSICKDYWNDLITYLTAGLLYGREVPRPAWAAAKRKNKYAPRPTREPSKRRPQIQELLLKGKSYAQISTELGLSERTVNDYACQIYRQHEVSGHHARRALAKRLNRQAPPNKPSKRQGIRFPQVLELLLKGQTHKQIGAQLGLSHRTVNDYICLIYRHHGVSGHHAREALARKFSAQSLILINTTPASATM
jgi:DNA-binding NarL/FixJ family response regulator